MILTNILNGLNNYKGNIHITINESATVKDNALTFKPIDGYNNYFISNDGDILNLNTGRIMKANINKNGYVQADLYKKNKRYKHYVHRLVAKAYLNAETDKTEVNHIDCNKLNNNLTNLEYVTHSENLQHAYDTGLINQSKGVEHHNAKLSDSDVKFIRDNYKVNYTGIQLAKMFNVSRLTIYKVANYISYID